MTETQEQKSLPDLSSVRIVTPPGRLSFPNLTEAKENPFNNRVEFSTSLIFRKESVTESELWRKMWRLILMYGLNELGGKAVVKDEAGKPRPQFKINGIVDGDNTDRDEQSGFWIIRAKAPSTMPPVLVNSRNEALGDDEVNEVYPGANASLLIGLYYYSSKQFGNGCSFNLYGVKLLGGGDAFAGGAPMETDDVKGAFAEAGSDLPQLEAPAAETPSGKVAAPVGGMDFDDDIPF